MNRGTFDKIDAAAQKIAQDVLEVMHERGEEQTTAECIAIRNKLVDVLFPVEGDGVVHAYQVFVPLAMVIDVLKQYHQEQHNQPGVIALGALLRIVSRIGNKTQPKPH